MKLMIIGYSGGGKSTLASKLSQLYSIPKLHMDTIQFFENWQDRPREDVQADLRNFMQTHSSWVIDGNYSWCDYQERLEQADQIIFLNLPRMLCLYRAFKRYLTYRHRVRESSAPGCQEKLDWEFIRWILKDGRSPKALNRYRSISETYPEKFIELKSQKEIDSFLSTIHQT